MKLLINVVKILFGIALLTAGIGGGVGLCMSSPKALKMMVFSGVPVSCPIHGSEVKIPGRLVAAVVISVPIGALLGAWWVLGSVFRNGHERDV